jgi:cytoskeletal protein CcmA (bactofilin family)
MLNAVHASRSDPEPEPANDESVVEAGLLVRGGLETRGRLHIHGEVSGEVRVERLVVSEAGSLEGAVEAVVIEVHGRVTGSLKGKDVRLHAGARVEADITYETLTIEPGARFEGRCVQAVCRPLRLV